MAATIVSAWVGRHCLVVLALEKDHRAGEAIEMMDRRSLNIKRFRLRQRTNQPVEVARLEFMRVLGEQHQIRDAIEAGSGFE